MIVVYKVLGNKGNSIGNSSGYYLSNSGIQSLVSITLFRLQTTYSRIPFPKRDVESYSVTPNKCL